MGTACKPAGKSCGINPDKIEVCTSILTIRWSAWRPEGIRVPAELRVGSVRIAPATVLAPMAGVTDTVFRRFIREMGGCGLLMTEFTSADGVVAGAMPRPSATCTSSRTSGPFSSQLFGSHAESLAEAAAH